MTVNSTTITNGPYLGNDVTEDFSYSFTVKDKTQLIVFETDDFGVQTVLTVDTNYTVNGVGTEGGDTVTRTAGPLPTDFEWYIRSDYQELQKTDLDSQGGFFPDVHEDAFDKLTYLALQNTDINNRSPTLPEGYGGPLPLSLPLPVEGQTLVWNSGLDGFDNEDSGAQSAANAAASAAAALVSENNAESSADDAQVSEDNAATSETNALASEDKAQEWAENPEDDPVETGPDQFSALHWAAKAEATQVEDLPPLFIGNITNPLVDLKLKNTIDFTGVGTTTFTRASSATYIDRYGIVQSAAIDVIRFEAEGALLEGASTNELIRSEELDDAIWVKNLAVITPDAVVAPDGTMTMDLLANATAVTASYAEQQFPSTPNGTYSVSIFAKSVAAGLVNSVVSIRMVFTGGSTVDKKSIFDTENGVWLVQDSGHFNFVQKLLDDGSWHLGLAVTDTGSNNVVRPRFGTEGAGGAAEQIYLWGEQAEEFEFSTSYIPTVASTVARAADILTLSQPNNVQVENAPSTIVCDFSLIGLNSGSFGFIWEIDSVDNNRPIASITGGGSLNTQYGGGGISTTPPSLSTPSRIVTTYDGTNLGFYLNGILINTVDQGALYLNDLTRTINIGSSESGSNHLFGHISRLQIFDRELSAFEASIV